MDLRAVSLGKERGMTINARGSWRALVASGLALGIGAEGAQASFPGANGRIAYTSTTLAWAPLPPGPLPPRPPLDPDAVSMRFETVLPNGRGRRVLYDFPVAGGYGEPGDEPAWSPRGRALAFRYGARLAIVRGDGTGLRRLPPFSQLDQQPAWSPDGRRLAFVGSHQCLYCSWLQTVRSDGTGLRRVTELGAAWPTWSVKGTLAFVNSDDRYREPNPDDGLYTVRPDGSRQRRVFKRYWGTGVQPDWSPDGRSLAFGARGHIFTMRGNGRRLRRLTDLDTATGYGNSDPTWSPDGRYIAFIRDHDLYVMRADGHGLRRIVDARAEDPDRPYAEFTQLSSPTWQALPR
jgi:Tol biopolymer transport system component